MVRPGCTAALFIVLGLVSCAGRPEDCGVGGVADETAFAASFNGLELVDETTGQPGPPGGDGVVFPAATKIAVDVDAKQAVSLRFCLGDRNTGKILLDDTTAFEAGITVHPLGTFAASSYVVRCAVDGTLVRNLPFDTQ